MSRSALTRQANRKNNNNHVPALPSQAQSQQFQQAAMAAAGYPVLNTAVGANVTVTTTVNGVGYQYPYSYPGMTTAVTTPGTLDPTAAMTPEMMYYAQYAQYYQQQAAAFAAAGNLMSDPAQVAIAATRGDEEVNLVLFPRSFIRVREEQRKYCLFMVTLPLIISTRFSTII